MGPWKPFPNDALNFLEASAPRREQAPFRRSGSFFGQRKVLFSIVCLTTQQTGEDMVNDRGLDYSGWRAG